MNNLRKFTSLWNSIIMRYVTIQILHQTPRVWWAIHSCRMSWLFHPIQQSQSLAPTCPIQPCVSGHYCCAAAHSLDGADNEIHLLVNLEHPTEEVSVQAMLQNPCMGHPKRTNYQEKNVLCLWPKMQPLFCPVYVSNSWEYNSLGSYVLFSSLTKALQQSHLQKWNAHRNV